MSAKNRNGKTSIPGDRYYTPPWVVALLVNHVLPDVLDDVPTSILEPAAGTGNVVTQLREACPDALIEALDIDPDVGPWPEATASGVGANFLGIVKDFEGYPEPVDLLAGNPPYTFAQEFVEAGLVVADVVVYLVRMGFLSTAKRCEFLRAHPPSDIHIIPERPQFETPPGYRLEGGDSADYAWVTWKRGHKGKASTTWLPETPLEERRPRQ